MLRASNFLTSIAVKQQPLADQETHINDQGQHGVATAAAGPSVSLFCYRSKQTVSRFTATCMLVQTDASSSAHRQTLLGWYCDTCSNC